MIIKEKGWDVNSRVIVNFNPKDVTYDLEIISANIIYNKVEINNICF